MKNAFVSLNKFVLFALLLAMVTTLSFAPAAAQSGDDVIVELSAEMVDREDHDHDHDDCVIPPSGPWPPCATGGNGGSDSGNSSSDDCVIPPSGPWPPCATDGSGGGQPAPGNGGGQACPASGPWPPGCVPNGGGGNQPAPTPSDNGDCVIPPSGPWPPCATDGSGGAAPAPAPAAGIPLSVIEQDIRNAQPLLQNYWLAEFKQWGISYQPPSLVQTYVGEEGAPPNAFYVPSANAIFIDLRLLTEVANEYGRFGAVAVLAHEWAHFIQDELDVLSIDRPLRQIELQADCFSGSFTQYMRGIGQVSDADYQLASQLFFSIGDDQINPGAPYDQPGAHGTGVERQTAYDFGWNNSANSCRGAYNN